MLFKTSYPGFAFPFSHSLTWLCFTPIFFAKATCVKFRSSKKSLKISLNSSSILLLYRKFYAGEQQTYRLLDSCLNTWPVYLLMAVVILGLATYAVLMLLKKSNLVSNVVIFVLAIAPFVLILFNIGMLEEEGEFMKIGGLVIGAGIRSGLTDLGMFLLISLIAFFILLVVGFSINHRKLLREAEEQPTKAPKEIKVKKSKKIDVSKNDFHIS